MSDKSQSLYERIHCEISSTNEIELDERSIKVKGKKL